MKDQELKLLNHNIRPVLLNELPTKDNQARRVGSSDLKESLAIVPVKPVYYG